MAWRVLAMRATATKRGRTVRWTSQRSVFYSRANRYYRLLRLWKCGSVFEVLFGGTANGMVIPKAKVERARSPPPCVVANCFTFLHTGQMPWQPNSKIQPWRKLIQHPPQAAEGSRLSLTFPSLCLTLPATNLSLLLRYCVRMNLLANGNPPPVAASRAAIWLPRCRTRSWLQARSANWLVECVACRIWM